MNAGPFASLIADFAKNWAAHRPALSVTLAGSEIKADQNHPLLGEMVEFCKGHSASLPFFRNSNEVFWCTLAPDSDALRKAVSALNAWVLPSFGGAASGDGYTKPDPSKDGLASKILAASPDGYYRWRCPQSKFDQVAAKLQLQRFLEQARPEREHLPRPSLYELRARFASALLIGDRDGAEQIIGQLDLYQLESAVNTQFMRIRLWHHFGELDRIRNHPDLPHLLAQPLPPRVREWINEALGVSAASPVAAPVPPSPAPAPEPPDPTAVAPIEIEAPLVPPLKTWIDWLGALKAGNTEAAQMFLQEQSGEGVPDFSTALISSLSSCLDDLVIDDTLRAREHGLILQGVGDLLETYVRERGFPRAALGGFYLSLLRLWCALHAGNSSGQEHGHVLLELASALLQLNQSSAEVCETLENWWKAKPAPSLLYFALDAIELMEREIPGTEAPANLWIAAADVIKRAADALPPADRELWRRVGARIGFDETTISQYLPPDPPAAQGEDPLAAASLGHVAIVCLREQQAKQAADEIRKRTDAKVTVVTNTAAGAETSHACTADVVLFVWLASTHAVYRAFDSYDRQCLCYVQGTGSSSIVRALERWVISR
jgi:hypothetical protein